MVLLEVVRVLYNESRVEVVMFCKTHRDFLAEGDEAAMAKRNRKDIKQVFMESAEAVQTPEATSSSASAAPTLAMLTTSSKSWLGIVGAEGVQS